MSIISSMGLFEVNKIINGDSIQLIKEMDDNYVHLILSDIPYGISYADWDVLHNNTNSALLGTSPSQEKLGSVFKKRGKPLNGWSEADKKIPLEYYEWCSSWASEWLRVLKPGGSAFVFAGRRLCHRCICAMEDAGFIFKDMISWEKETAPHRAQRVSAVFDRRKDTINSEKWGGWRLGNLSPLFEPILWFMKPYKVGGTLTDNILDFELGAYNIEEWRNYNSSTSNMIKIKTTKNDHGYHPTQKPVSLLEAIIKLTTKENHIVFDPFCGSGSTLVAAQNLNRNFIGIELSGDYCQVAKERLNMHNNCTVKINTNEEIFK